MKDFELSVLDQYLSMACQIFTFHNSQNRRREILMTNNMNLKHVLALVLALELRVMHSVYLSKKEDNFII